MPAWIKTPGRPDVMNMVSWFRSDTDIMFPLDLTLGDDVSRWAFDARVGPGGLRTQ